MATALYVFGGLLLLVVVVPPLAWVWWQMILLAKAEFGDDPLTGAKTKPGVSAVTESKNGQSPLPSIRPSE
jgi:hypothetical protein